MALSHCAWPDLAKGFLSCDRPLCQRLSGGRQLIYLQLPETNSIYQSVPHSHSLDASMQTDSSFLKLVGSKELGIFMILRLHMNGEET
jgi:hypothetical protein